MAQAKMTLEDWLDDLCVRFIINLPQEDLLSVARICFQVEEAQWFYEDFIRPIDPNLPSMTLQSFCLRMFQHCPLLAHFSTENHLQAFQEFMLYKQRVPVRGAILLNREMDSVVLVKGWKKSASWTFPRGKINKDEDDLDCAIREVDEETGYDVREAGLVPPHDPPKYIEVNMKGQHIRLYVIRNVPMDTYFEPKTRKEISKIQWWKLADLPGYRRKKTTNPNAGHPAAGEPPVPNQTKNFYMIPAFLVPLRKLVTQLQKKDDREAAARAGHPQTQQIYPDEPLTEDEIGHYATAPAPSQGPPREHDLESATHALRNLLRVQPPTQGLQIASPTAKEDAGQQLLSLLQQPKFPTANPAPVMNQTMQDPQLINAYNVAPGPPMPPHHPIQQMDHQAYQQQPQFPMMQHAHGAMPQQYQQRPDMQFVHGPNGRPDMMNPNQQTRDRPVQLLHPQPLPPQVQNRVLQHGILPGQGFPDAAQQSMVNPQAQGGRGFGQVNQLNQPQPPPQPAPVSKPAPQLTAHSRGLLDVLKHSGPQPGASQQPAPAATQQSPFPATATPTNASYSSQLGNLPFLPGLHQQPPNTGPGNGPSVIESKSPPTSDKHRSNLLGMFKKNEAFPSDQKEVVSPATAALHSQPVKPGQVSAADLLQSAAQENGRPTQMNPELNLPFGALTILSRGQALENAHPVPTSQASSYQENIKNTRQPSQFSPQVNAAAPQQNIGSPATAPIQAQPRQQMQSHGSPAYPYGSPRDPISNPQTSLPSPPAPSSLPVPAGILKPRQEATPEQRNNLLSLFGRPSGTPDDKGKGKAREAPTVDPTANQRARFPSSASGTGDLASGDSRRGSATPLSPADQAFLFRFLESTAQNAHNAR